MKTHWKKPAGNWCMAMYFGHQSIRDYLQPLSAVACRFSSWLWSPFVSNLLRFRKLIDGNVWHNFLFSCCHVGHAIASLTRSFDDIGDLFVRIYGTDRRILLRSTVQNDEGSRMETRRILNRNTLSGHRVWNVLLPEFLHLGQTFKRCRSIYHNDFVAVSVVWNLRAIGLSGLLLRIPKTSISTSR